MENKHINGKNLDADTCKKGTTVMENPKGKSAVKDKQESSRSKESESTSCDKDKPIESKRSESNEIIKQEPIKSDESGGNSDLIKSGGVIIKDELPDNQEVIDLTKKIFSSLPIKSESVDIAQKNKHETVNKTYMYVSEDGKVYHAAPTESGKQYSSEKDKNSVVCQDGVEYEIRPVKDDQLCELMFEYLKLKKTDPTGVFTISFDSSNSETMEEENVIKEEPKEMEEHESKNDEEKNEDEPLRRKQPTRGAKMNKVVSYNEQVEDEDWDVKTSCTQTPAPQSESKNSKQAALKKLYSTAPMVPLPKMDNQDYLTLVLEKSARSSRKRKAGLIIDNKTDIPILEMKMNMQVTADTLCQTPQMAPTSKKQMESLEKDSILVSPGKKLQSEKLIKLYNSRLISSSVPDSDDELEDLGLEKGIKPPEWMKKRYPDKHLRTGSKKTSGLPGVNLDLMTELLTGNKEQLDCMEPETFRKTVQAQTRGGSIWKMQPEMELNSSVTVNPPKSIVGVRLIKQDETSQESTKSNINDISNACIKVYINIFDIESMVETINRNVAYRHGTAEILPVVKTDDIETLVETINRTGANPSRKIKEETTAKSLDTIHRTDAAATTDNEYQTSADVTPEATYSTDGFQSGGIKHETDTDRSPDPAFCSNVKPIQRINTTSSNVTINRCEAFSANIKKECEPIQPIKLDPNIEFFKKDFDIDAVVDVVNRNQNMVQETSSCTDDIETLVKTFSKIPGKSVTKDLNVSTIIKPQKSFVGLRLLGPDPAAQTVDEESNNLSCLSNEGNKSSARLKGDNSQVSQKGDNTGPSKLADNTDISKKGNIIEVSKKGDSTENLKRGDQPETQSSRKLAQIKNCSVVLDSNFFLETEKFGVVKIHSIEQKGDVEHRTKDSIKKHKMGPKCKTQKVLDSHHVENTKTTIITHKIGPKSKTQNDRIIDSSLVVSDKDKKMANSKFIFDPVTKKLKLNVNSVTVNSSEPSTPKNIKLYLNQVTVKSSEPSTPETTNTKNLNEVQNKFKLNEKLSNSEQNKVLNQTPDPSEITTDVENIESSPSTGKVDQANTSQSNKKGKRKADDELPDGNSNKRVRLKTDGDGYERTVESLSSTRMKSLDGAQNKMYKYKCKCCVMGFDTQQTLESHMKTCTQSRGFDQKQKLLINDNKEKVISKFRCPTCEKTFDKPLSLANHVRIHKEYNCTICKKRFSNSVDLQTHSKTHKAKQENASDGNNTQSDGALRSLKTLPHSDDKKQEWITKCKLCAKSFRSRSDLERHVISFHKGNQQKRKIKCDLCEESFETTKELLSHTAMHKEEKRKKKEKDEIKNNDAERKINDKEKEKNNKEGKKNKEEKNNDEEGKKKEKEKNNRKERKEKEIEGERKNKECGKPVYTCKKCNVSFEKGSSLAAHVKTHNIQKCTVCSTVLGSVRNFVQHMKLHEDVRCNYCDKYLYTKSELETHVRTHTDNVNEIEHEPISMNTPSNDDQQKTKTNSCSSMNTPGNDDQLKTKPYSCLKCSMAFASEKELNDHMKEHSEITLDNQVGGRSIYPCHKCSGLFTKKDDLLKHVKVHDDKGTKCNVCNMEFNTDTELMEHHKMHNDTESLKCTICFLSFASLSELGDHIEKHDKERHKCDICFKCFGTIEELEKHSETMHNIFSKKCPKCDKIFLSSSDFERHIKTNCKSKKYVCEACNRPFDTKKELERHFKSHERKKDFVCSVCSAKFDDIQDLKKHQKYHIQECKICFKKFISEDILNEHMKVHYGKNCLQCMVCSKCFPSEKTYKEHEKSAHGDEILTCDICQSSYKSMDDLREHIKTHQPKKFACSDCDRAFTSQNDLSTHWRLEHNQGMNFVCGLCKIPFRTEKDLTTHVREFHDKVEYKCGICEQTFTSEKKLTDHMPSHQAEFQCGLCQKEFITETELLEHLQFHAIPAAATTSIQCKECGEKFETQNDLEEHTSSNHLMEEFQCGYCHCFFSSNETLVQHVVTHMTSPLYSCDMCGEVFKLKSDYEKHQHSGKTEKTFVCGVCSFVAKNRTVLMGHLKKHL